MPSPDLFVQHQGVPALTSHKIRVDPKSVDLMRDSSGIRDDMVRLRERIDHEGYLYLPGFLDPNLVMDARRSITDKLAAEGSLDPAFPAIQAIIRPGKDLIFRSDLTIKDAAIAKLLYSGKLVNFFTRFLGGEVRHFDFTWMRTVGPGRASPPHCDIVYMGRGTQNLFSAWTPLGDVPFDEGGLMVLERSNTNQRLRETYCTMDVDSYCSNRTGRLSKDWWAMKGNGGALNRNPNVIRGSIGGHWRTADYKCGDVVLFSAFTVHCSADNHTNKVRLSVDSRYQLANDPIDERWVGESPVGHGPLGKRGRIC